MKHWSFSALKSFEQCPRKFFEIKVAQSVKEPEHPSAAYGKLVHEAAENNVRHGTPIPAEFAVVAETVVALRQLTGEHRPEFDASLRQDLTPTTSDDPEVWYKGFIDLLILQPESKCAKVVDYKTGNSKWADTDQLEIYALAVFEHFPWVEHVDGLLAFVKDGVGVAKSFCRDERTTLWGYWAARLARRDRCAAEDKWLPKPSGLCKFCPVQGCEHHPSWKGVSNAAKGS